MLLLANPNEERKLTEAIMISYAMINIVNTGLYGKSVERWNNLTTSDRKKWVECRAFFIAEYERRLREGKGPTDAQEGYWRILNSLEGYDGESIVEAIMYYADIATSAESKMSEMESEFSQINLAIQNPQAVYFSLHQQAFQAPPKLIKVPTQPGP